MAELTNLFADIPAAVPEELIQTLLATANLRIERIVSLGHASPEGFWYDQEAHEWVMLLTAAARLTLEGDEPLELRPGAFANIPAHRRHRVEWTDPQQPTVWLRRIMERNRDAGDNDGRAVALDRGGHDRQRSSSVSTTPSGRCRQDRDAFPDPSIRSECSIAPPAPGARR